MSKRILVVEDNMIIRLDLVGSLKRAGFDVVGGAATGEKALAMLQDKQPDIVLMDIGLKGSMDGIDTAQKMNELGDTPIVFLSGNSDPATIEKANTTKYKGFLIKPVNMQQLLDVLNS